MNASAVESLRDFFLGAQMDLAHALMLDGSESFVCGDFQIGRQLRLRRALETRVNGFAGQALSYFNENFPLLSEHPRPLRESGMAIRATLIERGATSHLHLYRVVFEAAFREMSPSPASASGSSSMPSEQAQL